MPPKKYNKLIPKEGGDIVMFSEKPFDVINETPLDNRIIVKENVPPATTPAGIFLPKETTGTKPYTGIVLAAGPECSTVKLHDQVRYPKRAGEQIEINGEEYLMLRETDCYTILNK